jgi:hypothetical protein
VYLWYTLQNSTCFVSRKTCKIGSVSNTCSPHCIYWAHVTDHVTLRLHTVGLYLTNYVTSEGNWLHQILFRGFIAKGVSTSAIWTILCMSIIWNPNKNVFKLQVLMQQNRKNAKWGEYVCKALYVTHRAPSGKRESWKDSFRSYSQTSQTIIR